MSIVITDYTPPIILTIRKIKLSVNVYELKFNKDGQLVYFNGNEVKPSNDNIFNLDEIRQKYVL